MIKTAAPRLPEWLRPKIGKASEISTVQKIIKERNIHTICEEGRCPNRAECYANKTATFLLMGATCTRNCGFCQVDKGHAPMPLDQAEPQKAAEAIALLGLEYVVLTSVARDDLPDQGSGHFVEVMQAIRQINPDIKIEVLTPDFRGDRTCIAKVVSANPVCYNHNIETVKRLQGVVRRGAKYDRSLGVLQTVKELNPEIITKSGLMVGHGESVEEITETMTDLRSRGISHLTIGQYLQPSLEHLPVRKYWTPTEFDQLKAIALEIGFNHVESGALVRSSYHAGQPS
jgi:lipoic acid synthetase